MNDLYPGLPHELEDDWIDAIASGEISEPLARFLDEHPAARDELSALDDVAMALRRDRDAAHPGPHFFDALAGDIMASLPEPDVAPATLVGRKVKPAEPGQKQSWWAAAWAWFGKHPTMAWGAVMALGLVAILAWPRSDDANDGFAETGPDVGMAAVHPDASAPESPGSPEPSKENWLAAALPQGLSRTEVHELRQVAAQIEVSGLDLDESDDGLDDDWGLGVGAGAILQMGGDELDSALDALEAPL
jgi:hypothetical protein